MHYLHQIDPLLFSVGPFHLGERTIGPFGLHWYGLMYLAGLGAGYWLGLSRIRSGRWAIAEQAYSNLIFDCMLGVIVGGRIGYMLFYNFHEWLADPLSLLRVWEGGMSFHGGLLGVLVAGWRWSRANGLLFWDTVDIVAPLVPPGLGLVRLGNFINGELWGKVSDLPWAVIFPSGLPQPMDAAALQSAYAAGQLEQYARHPTPLYEASLEGLVMFTVLWLYSRQPRPRYAVSALFALMYAAFRFGVEFIRVPDVQLGYLALGWLTMGQILCLPLFVTGAALWWKSRTSPVAAVQQPARS